MPIMDGIQLTERLAQELPASPVIIMSVQGERDYLRRAMQAGAREYLIKPFSHDELVAAIRRVHQLEEKKGTFARDRGPGRHRRTTGGGARRGDRAVLRQGRCGQDDARDQPVGGARGRDRIARGAGRPRPPVRRHRRDAQPRPQPEHHRRRRTRRPSSRRCSTRSWRTGPNGVRVLLAPISPELADLITNDHVRMVMAELRKTFDYVIVDTSSPPGRLQPRGHRVRPAHPRGHGAHHPGDQGREARAQGARVADRRPGLGPPGRRPQRLALRLQQGLDRAEPRHSVGAQIPYDPRVVGDSINRGIPFVTSSPEADISRSIRELAGALVPGGGQPVGAGVAAGKADDKRKRRIFGR